MHHLKVDGKQVYVFFDLLSISIQSHSYPYIPSIVEFDTIPFPEPIWNTSDQGETIVQTSQSTLSMMELNFYLAFLF